MGGWAGARRRRRRRTRTARRCGAACPAQCRRPRAPAASASGSAARQGLLLVLVVVLSARGLLLGVFADGHRCGILYHPAQALCESYGSNCARGERRAAAVGQREQSRKAQSSAAAARERAHTAVDFAFGLRFLWLAGYGRAMKHRDAIRKLSGPPPRRLRRRRSGALPAPPRAAARRLPSAEPSAASNARCTFRQSTPTPRASRLLHGAQPLHYRRRPLADDAAAVVQNLDALGGSNGDDDDAADAPLVQNLDARLRDARRRRSSTPTTPTSCTSCRRASSAPRRRAACACSPSLARRRGTCDLAVCQSGAAASQLWVRQRIARLRRAVADGGGGGGGGALGAPPRAPPPRPAPAGLLSCLCSAVRRTMWTSPRSRYDRSFVRYEITCFFSTVASPMRRLAEPRGRHRPRSLSPHHTVASCRSTLSPAGKPCHGTVHPLAKEAPARTDAPRRVAPGVG